MLFASFFFVFFVATTRLLWPSCKSFGRVGGCSSKMATLKSNRSDLVKLFCRQTDRLNVSRIYFMRRNSRGVLACAAIIEELSTASVRHTHTHSKCSQNDVIIMTDKSLFRPLFNWFNTLFCLQFILSSSFACAARRPAKHYNTHMKKQKKKIIAIRVRGNFAHNFYVRFCALPVSARRIYGWIFNAFYANWPSLIQHNAYYTGNEDIKMRSKLFRCRNRAEAIARDLFGVT